MTILTREQALRVSGRAFKIVPCPELEGELRLTNFSAGQAVTFAELREVDRKAEGSSATRRAMMVYLIRAAIVDEKGEPIFDEQTSELFFDRISFDTLNLILKEQPAPAKVAAPAGNSEASPSVA